MHRKAWIALARALDRHSTTWVFRIETMRARKGPGRASPLFQLCSSPRSLFLTTNMITAKRSVPLLPSVLSPIESM